MTHEESTSNNYAQMPLEARKQLALSDPEAARVMALDGLIVLATEEGYRALEEQAKRDLATVLAKQQAIGASYADDADEMENTEQQYLKAEMPAYARVYAESLERRRNALVYSEELPGRVSFGSKLAAIVQYPDREQPTTRNYLLVGPGELALWQGRYADQSGERFTVVSYLSPVGRVLWGAELEQTGQPPTFPLPDSVEPAVVMHIALLGKV